MDAESAMNAVGYTVAVADRGEVVIEGDDGSVIRFRRVEAGWVMDGVTGTALPWTLRRESDADGGGYGLRSADSAILGMTSSLGGSDDAGGESSLLTADGRLFRIRASRRHPIVVELLGWETPGAYVTANFESDRWRLSPTIAGSVLGVDPVILILFAVEVANPERGVEVDAGGRS